MIDGLFYMMVMAGILLTLYAHEKENIIYSTFSVILWLYIAGNCLWIEVPFSTGPDSYTEITFGIFSLIFVFINAIQLLYLVMDWRTQKQN